jgi:hypothetical protein
MVLEAALARMVAEDSDLIDRDPAERSLTHCLALYLQLLIPGWPVDCEYNRDVHAPQCIMVAAPSVKADDSDAVTTLPDIVLHRRGSKNLLVIEARKASSRTSNSFDQLKLEAYKKVRVCARGVCWVASVPDSRIHSRVEMIVDALG